MKLPTVRTNEQILTEMKVATGWKNIHLVGNTFVIQFRINDLSVIKGLRQTRDTFVLDFRSFDGLAISFLVTMNESTHQYWTLNGNLHRYKDLPAYVGIDNSRNRTIQRWYWNGIRHRQYGPAMIVMDNPSKDEIAGFKNHYQVRWDTMNMEWWREGFMCKYPYPGSASTENGWSIFNKDGNLDSPREDLSAWGSTAVDMEWAHGAQDPNILLPRNAEFVDLVEWYDDGKLTSRKCSRCDFIWVRGSDTIQNGLTTFHEALKSGLLRDLGLWNQKFYPTDEIEFLVLSEYDRFNNV